jgi:CarD family transcriptional regulator
MNFQVGDLVVYEGSNYICRVVEITRLDIPNLDKERLYYILKTLDHNCVIYTPADNVNMSMRPVISKEDAKKLIDMIPEVKAEPYQSDEPREVAEHYKSVMKTRDCAKLIELTMSIYTKKQFLITHNRKFSSQEDAFMKQAEGMLFEELSVALDIPKEQIKSYIAARVDALRNDAAFERDRPKL